MGLTRETLGQWIDAMDELWRDHKKYVLEPGRAYNCEKVLAQMYDLYKWWGEPERKQQDYDVWRETNRNNGHRYYVGYYGKLGVARTRTLFNCIEQCYKHACDRNPLNTQVLIANNTSEKIPDGIRLYQHHGTTYNCAALYTTHDKQLWHA